MTDLLASLQTALGERYALERELGRGGMATVYLARDTKHGRHVAVKVLHPDLAAALGPDRFRREIQIATSLSHPHILALYDSGAAEGQLYYVMPFVEGESLRARLDREKQLPVEDALRITCEVADALDYAHRRGVVHRDIKPENILLEDGHAIVADFGIARAVSAMADGPALTQTGVALGTPVYMSPEQAFAEKEIDGRSDEYSLACVLYEMLVGQPPFHGPSAQAIMARHSMESVPSLRIVRQTIPDEVEDAVMQALEKSPADRFATVGQFATTLRACMGLGATAQRRVTMRGTSRRPAVRRRSPALAVGGVLLGLVVIGWAGWRFALQTRSLEAGVAAGEFDPRRVAVLYFDDLDKNGQQGGLLADGLTESLIEQLDQVKSLDVVSKSGAAQFRDKDVSPDSVARVLKAGTLVRGSVEQEGSRVHVAVRLVDGNSGVDLNRKSFDLPAGNVLAVRDTLAQEVARFLRERVGAEVRLREQRTGTANGAAWMLVQQTARVEKDADARLDAGNAVEARAKYASADSLLARAEQLDPKWPTPVVQRGWLAYQQTRSLNVDPVQAARLIDVGLGHAQRALALDARNPDALELRGTLRFWKVLKDLVPDPTEAATLLRTAEEDLRAAVAIAPSHATAWNTLSRIYASKYNRVESSLAARRAYEEDAYLSVADQIIFRLFALSYDLEQFVDATHWCEEGYRRYPDQPRFTQCQLLLMTSPSGSHDVDEAWRLVGEVNRLAPKNERELMRRLAQMVAAVPIARAGMVDSARHVLEHSRAGRDLDPSGELGGMEVAMRALIGDKDEAIRLLKLYLTSHPEHREGYIKANTWWYRSLQDDPRFKELIAPR